MFTFSGALTILYIATGQQSVSNHNAGKGAKYTRSRRTVKLVRVEEYSDKPAMNREWHIKHMSRAEKLNLVETTEQDE